MYACSVTAKLLSLRDIRDYGVSGTKSFGSQANVCLSHGMRKNCTRPEGKPSCQNHLSKIRLFLLHKKNFLMKKLHAWNPCAAQVKSHYLKLRKSSRRFGRFMLISRHSCPH